MAKPNVVKRIVAYLIDSIIGGGVSLVLTVVILGIFWVLMMVGAASESMTLILASFAGMMVGLVVIMAPMVLYALFKDGLFGGRSIGKKITGLRVENVKLNRPCSMKDSFLRNITMLIPVLGWIDMILPIIDAEGLRIGDKIAGTRVVG
ncbi:MAG: RDD family protein [Candidatus Altiarchaeota archaeon]|nr:RDD family protein [Candidatus Altiarchaeota archaeon]